MDVSWVSSKVYELVKWVVEGQLSMQSSSKIWLVVMNPTVQLEVISLLGPHLRRHGVQSIVHSIVAL
jgi:hypothetical protein